MKYKVKTTKHTIKQRNGESPDILVVRKSYIPTHHIIKTKGKKEPTDYGVTREQFHQILDKASQPQDKSEKS
jgi:hypothetical protein